MTKQEILSTYLATVPEKERKATGNDYEPVMPFLIGDIMYNIFVRDIDRLPFKHTLKLMRSRWHDEYNHFNKPFFSCFPEDKHADITDLMDDLESYLNNDIVMLRSQIMNIMDDMDFGDKKIMSSLLICYILAQYAHIEWKDTHRVKQRHGNLIVLHPLGNPHLDNIMKLSFNMAIAYFKPLKKGAILLHQLQADGTFAVIAKHINDWIKEK